MRIRLLLAGLAATLLVSSCSGSGDKPGCNGGSFTLDLDIGGGAPVQTFRGTACWCLAGTDFSIGLNGDDGSFFVVIGRQKGGKPGVGPLPLPAASTGEETDFALRARIGKNQWVACSAMDGTMSITTSNAASVDGSLAVPLLCTSGGYASAWQLTGTFQAVEGDVTPLP
jgi:hypothetical protein